MSPLRLIAPTRSSKKFIIDIETARYNDNNNNETAQEGEKYLIEPRHSLVIKLNNFLLWSSSGCVLPYLSVYFLRYTQADSNDVGMFMSISALLGTLVNFLVSSLSDRYQIHRQLYLTSLILVNLSLCVLFVPMLSSAGVSDLLPDSSDNDMATATSPFHTPALVINASTLQQDTVETTMTTQPPPPPPGQLGLGQQIEQIKTIDQDRPVWFYIVGACIAFGSLGITANMNFSDSFSTNIAHQSSSSFGSLRFYGALGWCAANFVLAMTNKFDTYLIGGLPYLLPAWLLFALLSGLNILLISSWPNKRPFDLSGKSESVNSGESRAVVNQEPEQKSREAAHSQHSRQQQQQPVALTRAAWMKFDALEELAAAKRPDVRRCSIAPLGKSHVLEQFELGGASCEAERSPGATTTKTTTTTTTTTTKMTMPHFKHITRVEQLKQEHAQSMVRLFHLQEEQKPAHETNDKKGKSMSFRLHLKIIELIARRNANIIRCMSLYAAVGFIISTNWYFLFPYLELLDTRKFLTISAWVMMSQYASETLFYYFSPHITSRFNAPNGLSAILFFFALRNSAYLTFAWWPQSPPGGWLSWPIELIILVEALQSLTMGWFDCIFNESALEFALEAEKCVPKLIELKLIEDTQDAREQVKNGVKLSLLSVSSCFFDGIGVGLGSLLGGWIIDSYGYVMLWSVCASFALSVCLVNIALELTIFSGGGGGGSSSSSVFREINK